MIYSKLFEQIREISFNYAFRLLGFAGRVTSCPHSGLRPQVGKGYFILFLLLYDRRSVKSKL